MKRLNFYLIILFVFVAQQAVAQREGGNREERQQKLKAQKVAYITDHLNLTVEESQKFWPLYNEFEAKRDKILNDRHEISKNYNKGEQTLSDKELEKLTDDFLASFAAEAKLSQDYCTIFKTALPIKKGATV